STRSTTTTPSRAGKWPPTGVSTMSTSSRPTGASPRRAPRVVAAGSVLLLIAVVDMPAGHAQLPTYGVGRAPTAHEAKAWDLPIPPNGQGLPPGSGTAALGKPLFARRCASCHGERGEDPKYRVLTGGLRPLTSAGLPKEGVDWLIGGAPALTIGSFWQYAT